LLAQRKLARKEFCAMTELTYARPGGGTAIAVITPLSRILNTFWGATRGISMANGNKKAEQADTSSERISSK